MSLIRSWHFFSSVSAFRPLGIATIQLVVCLSLKCFALDSTVPAPTIPSATHKTDRELYEALRRILQTRSFFPTTETSDTPECSMTLASLRNNRVLIVEPVVRTDSAVDPRLKVFAACDTKENEGRNEIGQPFQRLSQLGTRSFRYWRGELDGNPENGDEHLVYAEWDTSAAYARLGPVGITAVDLNECSLWWGAGSEQNDRRQPPAKSGIWTATDNYTFVVRHNGVTKAVIVNGRRYAETDHQYQYLARTEPLPRRGSVSENICTWTTKP